MNIRLRVFSAFAAVGLTLVASGVSAQVVCLPIEQVRVDGAAILGPVDVQAIVTPYEGHCIGLVEFDQILEAVTLAYVDRGYVLSRAYLPEQDLTSGTLIVKVVEGELSSIRINDEQRPYWAGVVFPGLIGKPVNIRDVEQGLDQIEAMPRWTAQIAFEAGATPGDSVLEVEAASPKPFEIKLTTNNRGNDQTGLWNTGMSGDFSNLMGLNDTWTWNISKSVGPHPVAFGGLVDSNRSADVKLTLPYGPWTLSFAHAWSDYQLTVPGAISPIVTAGFTRTQTLTARYLLDRDQTTKQYLSAEFTRARNQNFIQDVPIDNSSRVLTGLKLGYAISTPLSGGTFDGAVHYEQGLTWLGSEIAADLPAGSPNPQYALVGFSADYARSVGAAENGLRWTSTASGQYSRDRLYGGQSYSIGGVSTVRGSKIGIASGSSGLLWRNELEYSVPQAAINSVAVYAALDVGHVLSQPDLNILSATAAGGAIGLKLRDDQYTFDVSYQQILSVSEGLQQPEGQILMSFEIIF